MVKKLALTISMLLFFIAGGCVMNNKTDNTTVKKNNKIQVTLKGATYIKPNEIGNNNKELLAIEMKIKNIGKNNIYINPESFGLVAQGDDEKISSKFAYSSDKNFKELSIAKLTNGSAKTGYVAFPVNDNKKYVLTISPEGYGVRSKAIKINIDPSKYVSTKAITKEAEKAMDAYIDTVFLDKKNDNKKLLSDKTIKEGQEQVKSRFKEFYEGLFYTNNVIDQKRLDQAFIDYQKEQKNKFKLTKKIKGYMPQETVFSIVARGISRDSLRDKIKEANSKELKKLENDDGYEDDKKIDKIVMSQFKILLKNTTAEKINHKAFEGTVVKKAGKWSIDLNKSSSLLESYFGESYW